MIKTVVPMNVPGAPLRATWTLLRETVIVGDSDIFLQQSVDWHVDDEIVIASTGDLNSQKQNEKRRIVSISEDGFQLGLDRPLEYLHLGVTGKVP